MIFDDNISPEWVKSLSLDEKKKLCEHLRRLIIARVSDNGGHLASNLGSVELIVALHSVFETPSDKIVFDVGHQAYSHKIITGRYNEFSGLRKSGGISGYPRPTESVHDAFVAGHSGISVSAALGISDAMILCGDKGKVIAVAGDGAFTNGEIYEGLNNVSDRHKNLVVILNDNEMAISKNTGAIAGYLAKLRSSVKYNRTKNMLYGALDRSVIGKELSMGLRGMNRIVKSALIPDNLFENLGFKYYGPVDGHSLSALINMFEVAKASQSPCFIHIKTIKGKGLITAENNSSKHHAVSNSNHDRIYTFSEAFGRALLFFANRDKKICAITAAMKHATGCSYFAKQYPERFFDVGIAEGHAITFSAGLAAGGMIPVTAIYSTFLQRGFDQLIHDAAIENTHLVLAIDRAGLVGEDGETHQGTFDVAMLMSVPGSAIYSPSNADELKLCLEAAIYREKGVAAIRYPRGVCHPAPYSPVSDSFRYIKESGNILIVTYGRLIYTISRLQSLPKPGADIIQLIKIKPIPEEAIEIAKGYENIFFIEEAAESGGIGELLLICLNKINWKGNFYLRGINGFIPYGDGETQLRFCGLDYNSLARFIFNKEVEEERRLDIALAERGLARSRTMAQELIKKGCVLVNGKLLKKPSEPVKEKDEIKLTGESPRYVSRGGDKLEKAIIFFNIDLTAKTCLDIGASTGGFTDCMLQYGAIKVYTVDVGTNQLAGKLRQDERVVSFEQLDIRKAQGVIIKKFDFITIDVSFISLKLVLPKISVFMSDTTIVTALIKPQFEVGKKYLKNGIVSDAEERDGVVRDIKKFVNDLGFKISGVIPTEPSRPDRNIEYLMVFRKK
ncbi:MAG: 1-deoxy-D-xylulose-5-phosphate synthase [Eubacterium sp.]|nr:1-deoxy-D-xylulose-5-phosphate synthase [Eubacterium sp.]